MPQDSVFTHLSAEKSGNTTLITPIITLLAFLKHKNGPFVDLRALVEGVQKKIDASALSAVGMGLPDMESIAREIAMALHSHIQPETTAPVGDILEKAGITTTASLNRKLALYYVQCSTYFMSIVPLPYSFY